MQTHYLRSVKAVVDSAAASPKNIVHAAYNLHIPYQNFPKVVPFLSHLILSRIWIL
ncbi:hypothetical protein O9992_24190 [Vibrio lentus]|nr:hypothetical protein [Vibrio lentus]